MYLVMSVCMYTRTLVHMFINSRGDKMESITVAVSVSHLIPHRAVLPSHHQYRQQAVPSKHTGLPTPTVPHTHGGDTRNLLYKSSMNSHGPTSIS